MIPKTIHYCWLSGEDMPERFKGFIAGWKSLLPDYEIRLWDKDAMNDCKSAYYHRCVESGRYAFASDYVRLYALYSYGGIYLDCDVEVLKSFNPLLHLPYFICREDTKHGVEAAIMGAGKGCVWVKNCLDYYDTLPSPTGEVMPSVMRRVFQEKGWFLREIAAPEDFCAADKTLNIFPAAYFSPKSYVTNEIHLQEETFCIHHFAGSWQPWWKKCLLKLWVPLSYRYPSLARLLKK